jgi:hypothetical protein
MPITHSGKPIIESGTRSPIPADPAKVIGMGPEPVITIPRNP